MTSRGALRLFGASLSSPRNRTLRQVRALFEADRDEQALELVLSLADPAVCDALLEGARVEEVEPTEDVPDLLRRVQLLHPGPWWTGAARNRLRRRYQLLRLIAELPSAQALRAELRHLRLDAAGGQLKLRELQGLGQLSTLSAFGYDSVEPAELGLVGLSMFPAPISSLASLSSLGSLTHLVLGTNPLTRIDDLSALASLEVLWVGRSAMRALDLEGHSGIRELQVDGWLLRGPVELHNLPNLSALSLSDLARETRLVIRELPKLHSLKLLRCAGQIDETLWTLGITHLELHECLGQLPFHEARGSSLISLVLSRHMRARLDGIEALERLEHLSLASTNITDISPLRGLSLSQLSLANTPIEDLSPLADMATLQELDLRRCRRIKDLSTLERLPRLKRIYIGGSGIEPPQVPASLRLRAVS